MLEDFAAGSDLGVTVGSKGELVRCPALTDQVIRVRNRISGKSTENISDITDDLGNKIGQLKLGKSNQSRVSSSFMRSLLTH